MIHRNHIEGFIRGMGPRIPEEISARLRLHLSRAPQTERGQLWTQDAEAVFEGFPEMLEKFRREFFATVQVAPEKSGNRKF